MGDHQNRQSESAMSGPFSSGQVTSDVHSRRPAGAGLGGYGGGGGGGGSGFGGSRSVGFGSSSAPGLKTEGGISAGSSGSLFLKAEDGGFISSDEDEAKGRKHNIDDLQQVMDLTVEDNRESGHVFAPVRLKREPHKDRTIALTTEPRITSEDSRRDGPASSERRKGKQRDKELEVIYASQKPRRPTTYSSSDENDSELQIKSEPKDDGDELRSGTPPAIDGVPATVQSPPSSPESKRKAKEKVKEVTEETIIDDDDEYPLPDMPQFQTHEEVTEWRRHFADLNVIRTELGRQVPKTPITASIDGEGDTVMTAAESNDDPLTAKARRAEEVRSEHVYLFQFPPVLPSLVPVQVKPDPGASEDAVMDVDGPSQAPEVKEEANANNTTVSNSTLPSGYIGKLRVHKSGKAFLDWGGMSLELGAGADPTFLQSILIAKVPESKPDEEQPKDLEQEAVGIGLGQVRGKFVLTPNWDEILS